MGSDVGGSVGVGVGVDVGRGVGVDVGDADAAGPKLPKLPYRLSASGPPAVPPAGLAPKLPYRPKLPCDSKPPCDEGAASKLP